jgi:hypothetical protein
MVDRASSTHGERRNAFMMLMGKPERKRLLGRPRCMWEDNIKMFLGKIGWDGVDWIDLAQNRDKWSALVNAVINFQFSKTVGKFLSGCASGGFSRRPRLHGIS